MGEAKRVCIALGYKNALARVNAYHFLKKADEQYKFDHRAAAAAIGYGAAQEAKITKYSDGAVFTSHHEPVYLEPKEPFVEKLDHEEIIGRAIEKIENCALYEEQPKVDGGFAELFQAHGEPFEPLTTRKVKAGEYEVLRRRDGAIFRIINGRGVWNLLDVRDGLGLYKTLAAAKTAIPV